MSEEPEEEVWVGGDDAGKAPLVADAALEALRFRACEASSMGVGTNGNGEAPGKGCSGASSLPLGAAVLGVGDGKGTNVSGVNEGGEGGSGVDSTIRAVVADALPPPCGGCSGVSVG